MTRVAVIPTLTDGKYGLWSSARSEGRVPLNWGALLGRHGYDVTVVSLQPDCALCSIPGVTFRNPDEVGDVDWVLHGTTSVMSSNWFGRTTIRARHTVRLQWPTGAPTATSGDVVAVPHRCVADQVAAETGTGRDRIHVLPSPVLPLAWWEQACGVPATPMPLRDRILWAARDSFSGSWRPYGEAALASWETSPVLRPMQPLLLSFEQYEQTVVDRFRGLGGTLMTQDPLGDVLRAMRRSVITVTLPAIMGPTLYEAIFEDSAPLVWNRYGALFPELCAAARAHGVLLEREDQIRATMERLFIDWQMRAQYVDACKAAFTDNMPDRAMDAWRTMEARV